MKSTFYHNNTTNLNISSRGSLCDSLSSSAIFLENISLEDVTDVEVRVGEDELEVRVGEDELEGESCLLGRKYITVLPAVVTNSSKPKTVFLTELCKLLSIELL